MSIICVGSHPLILPEKAELVRRRSASSLQHRSLSYESCITSCRPLICGSTNSAHLFSFSLAPRAASSSSAVVEPVSDDACFYKETIPLSRTETVEGKLCVRLEIGKGSKNSQLTVRCSLPGKWILHWGVSYAGETGSEWDQAPRSMWPAGSAAVKDYAVDTPMKKSSEGDSIHEAKINFDAANDIASINFVLKDEDSGSWYQRRGRDFKVPLMENLSEDVNIVGSKKGWPGALLSNIINKAETSDAGMVDEPRKEMKDFYEEHLLVKHLLVENSLNITVEKSTDGSKNILYLETDLPKNVVVHWGICRDEHKNWEIPLGPYPPDTIMFKTKALRTVLQEKPGGNRRFAEFALNEEAKGFLFVFKVNETSWVNSNGNDFFVPLASLSTVPTTYREETQLPEAHQIGSPSVYTDEIINEIRNLVTDISAEKNSKTKSKEAQEGILQEIEKLAAEAYSIFRTAVSSFTGEAVEETDLKQVPISITSGTGTGYEILLQGFNWESNKSGKWYAELKEKSEEIAEVGFTVIWLPPPTESVSPEGYMPKDYYNLNSRYGNMEELKELVDRLHEVGMKVLGDVVLNHRCAHFQNQNGVWNIFGGRLNWDDRAVVADDPHFQGRGNKSSGDNFHAAPNIDHSQEFVRNDLKEWLNWLREEIGYDGWRLDFVRGFWGGYVKDYLEASQPYFAVGEYWDSLSYTYNDMDYNQDAHRQRIIDWINATNGTAGAFDVTTKGILHAALERCEYWRLSDPKGKPSGVVGWWPSRAVTFIENHDTGSTQGHWRFPGGKEMQGYAYILTHPGTPAVFYDHIYSHYRSEIASLISIRNRNKIHCRSQVKITKAERDVYAAVVDNQVAVKIGPGYYDPGTNWSVALEGRDYKVWELTS